MLFVFLLWTGASLFLSRSYARDGRHRHSALAAFTGILYCAMLAHQRTLPIALPFTVAIVHAVYGIVALLRWRSEVVDDVDVTATPRHRSP